MKEPRRTVDCLLIDLDDTLYQAEGMPQQCSANIRDYMRQRLSVPPNEVEELCLQFYLDYGTTLAGLVVSLLE